MLIGIMISSLEKSFRLVDIGPNPENREEVFFLL
jgi:U3 small nucleolar RNA-associated protein 22